MNGTSIPNWRPTSAMPSQSVDSTVRVSLRLASAAAAVYARSGLPSSGARFLRKIPFEPPRAGMIPSTRSVILSFLCAVVDVMQSLLHVRLQGHETIGDAIRDEAVAVQAAERIRTVAKLLTNSANELGSDRRNARDVFVGLAPFLAITHEDDGSTEVTGVANEAAGISHGAGNAREQIQILLGRKISDRAEPRGSFAVAEQADGLADMVGAGVDIRPEHDRLHTKLC